MSNRNSPDSWEEEFDAWVNSFPDTPPLSDEAISRASMYPDRWQSNHAQLNGAVECED
jgi:hypothetical protein